MLNDHRLPPKNGGAPARAVILLHGLGDSGTGGLLEVGRMWQNAFPDAEFLCPDAPFPFDMAPPSMRENARQWFSLHDFSQVSMLKGAKEAAPYLNEYIDHVLATRNLAPERLALVGFSQGTIMALYVAPRRAKAVAGIVGYSGILVGGERLEAEKKCSPRVLLVHGLLDEVVPASVLDFSEKALRQAGIPVSTVACPHTGHGIDERGLLEGLKFLKKVFA